MPRLAAVFAALFLAFAAVPAGAYSSVDSIYADAAIMSAGSRAAAISRLKSVPNVGVINLRIMSLRFDLGEGRAGQSFKLSVQKHAAGVASLRRALMANPVTRNALAKHRVDVNTVVGVDIGSNGSLRLYILY